MDECGDERTAEHWVSLQHIEEVKVAVEAGYKSVSLGSARLRTETAALSAVMMMQLAFRK